MEKILGGLVLVNGTDIWSTYGVFLVEDKRGGMDNLTAILTPSKTKTDTAGFVLSGCEYPGGGRGEIFLRADAQERGP